MSDDVEPGIACAFCGLSLAVRWFGPLQVSTCAQCGYTDRLLYFWLWPRSGVGVRSTATYREWGLFVQAEAWVRDGGGNARSLRSPSLPDSRKGCAGCLGPRR